MHLVQSQHIICSIPEDASESQDVDEDRAVGYLQHHRHPREESTGVTRSSSRQCNSQRQESLVRCAYIATADILEYPLPATYENALSLRIAIKKTLGRELELTCRSLPTPQDFRVADREHNTGGWWGHRWRTPL